MWYETRVSEALYELGVGWRVFFLSPPLLQRAMVKTSLAENDVGFAAPCVVLDPRVGSFLSFSISLLRGLMKRFNSSLFSVNFRLQTFWPMSCFELLKRSYGGHYNRHLGTRRNNHQTDPQSLLWARVWTHTHTLNILWNRLLFSLFLSLWCPNFVFFCLWL